VLRLSDPLFVPDLAQTSDYARALLHAAPTPPQRVERVLDTRPRLSDLIEHSPDLQAWIVLDAAALIRPVGSEDILRLQLKELITLAETGQVIVQIVPAMSTASALARSPVTLLSFPHGADVVYLTGASPLDGVERYGDAAAYRQAFDLLSAGGVGTGSIPERPTCRSRAVAAAQQPKHQRPPRTPAPTRSRRRFARLRDHGPRQ
jgi:hypothetical protein